VPISIGNLKPGKFIRRPKQIDEKTKVFSITSVIYFQLSFSVTFALKIIPNTVNRRYLWRNRRFSELENILICFEQLTFTKLLYD
jgi:hypothetical protein